MKPVVFDDLPMNARKFQSIGMTLLIAGFVLMFTSIRFDAILGILLFIGSGMYLFQTAGHGFPARSLMVTIASLQWCVAPLFSYYGLYTHFKYKMYVPQEDYFSYVVPATLAFAAGLSVLVWNRERQVFQDAADQVVRIIRTNRDLPLLILAIGMAATYLENQVPAQFAFVAYLVSLLRYVALIMLVFSPWRELRYLWIVVGSYFLFESILSSYLHEAFILAVLTFFYVLRQYHFGTTRRLVLLIVAVLLIGAMQEIKLEYRRVLIAQQSELGDISTILGLVDQEIVGMRSGGKDSSYDAILIRLNQGWVISRVLQYVPRVRDFQDGKTVREAIEAALLPRFLAPDKATAGGSVNFERYTGYQLRRTSMSISLVGEGYVNFGKTGGIVFMFVVGVFFSLLISMFMWIVRYQPLYLTFFPLIFWQAIKAETDLVTVLNHLTKSLLFTLVFYYGLRFIIKPVRRRTESAGEPDNSELVLR